MIVLTTINVIGKYLANFYIFKEKRSTRDYVFKCEDGALWMMLKEGWIQTSTFLHNGWINL